MVVPTFQQRDLGGRHLQSFWTWLIASIEMDARATMAPRYLAWSVTMGAVNFLVVGHQDFGHFRAGELRRWGNPLTQHLAHLGAR